MNISTCIQKANLPDLEIFTKFNPECDIVFGDTKEIQDALPNLDSLKWAQTIYAGVERLMDPANRRDYMLTNARDVFGASMSEFVFGYLLFFKKRIRPRVLAQRAKQWDDHRWRHLAWQDDRPAWRWLHRSTSRGDSEALWNESKRLHTIKRRLQRGGCSIITTPTF